jgi:hypothetical protein
MQLFLKKLQTDIDCGIMMMTNMRGLDDCLLNVLVGWVYIGGGKKRFF